MIDALNSLQQSLPLLLLRGAVLLAISFPAAFLLRRRAQHVRIVWATATLLLLALPMLQSVQVWHLPAVDLVPQKSFQPPTSNAVPTPALQTGEMQPLPAIPGIIPVEGTAQPPEAPPADIAPQEITPREPLPWLPILWLAGACLGFAYLALGRVVLWRIRSRRKPANTPWLESLAAVGKETGTAVGGRIFFVPEIGMPLTAGILSPEIWLPESARGYCSRDRRSVLRHELTHIRGRDALWQLLSSLALASQWMNPLAWVAARSFRLAQERVCDDLAMGAEDAAEEEYAHLLLEVARNAAHRTGFRMIAAPTLMMAKKSFLVKRMKLILDKNMKRTAITKPQAWLTTALAAALGLPMSLIGFGQDSPLPAETAKDPAPRIEPPNNGAALLKRKMDGITIPEINIVNATLAEALDFLHKSSNPQGAADTEKAGNGIDFVLLRSALPDSTTPLLDGLKEAVRGQEDKVEERRKILTIISRTKDITYRGVSSLGTQGGLDEDKEANDVIGLYNQLEAKKMQLQSQIDSLLKYDSEQLLVYAAGLDLPDNIIKSLYPQYLELKRQIGGMKSNGLGNHHPSIISQTGILDAMKRDLEEGVVNLRTRLQGQLEMTKERLAKAEIKKTEPERKAPARNIGNQDYIDAKRAFETDLALLENMKLRLITEEITAEQKNGDALAPKATNNQLVTLNLRQVPFEDALKYIVQQCGMSYAIRSSAVAVGSPDEIAELDRLSR